MNLYIFSFPTKWMSRDTIWSYAHREDYHWSVTSSHPWVGFMHSNPLLICSTYQGNTFINQTGPFIFSINWFKGPPCSHRCAVRERQCNGDEWRHGIWATWSHNLLVPSGAAYVQFQVYPFHLALAYFWAHPLNIWLVESHKKSFWWIILAS